MPDFEPLKPNKVQLDGHFYAHGMFHKYTGLADEAAYFLTTQLIRNENVPNVIWFRTQHGYWGNLYVK